MTNSVDNHCCQTVLSIVEYDNGGLIEDLSYLQLFVELETKPSMCIQTMASPDEPTKHHYLKRYLMESLARSFSIITTFNGITGNGVTKKTSPRANQNQANQN